MATERLAQTGSKGVHRTTEATHSSRPKTMLTALRRIVGNRWDAQEMERGSGWFLMETWTSQGVRRESGAMGEREKPTKGLAL